jgi:hypothetical protein
MVRFRTVAAQTGTGAVAKRPGGFASKRYGGAVAVVASAAALFAFAAYGIIDAAYLMSNNCFGDAGQMVCPASGPDWARPLPGAAAFLGLLVGLAGLTGRRIRTSALIVGFVLTAAGLVGSWLMAPVAVS